LEESKILPKLEVKEEKKKSLWDEEFKIDFDEEFYSNEELDKTLSVV
jgi:hypothetical protein